MLNSIGLANPGIDRFLTRNLRELGELGVPVWVSVGGFETDDYAEICSRLDDHAEVSAIELNVSCPNVDAPAENAAQIVSASRLATRKPLWAKLSPAVPDIAEVARAAQAAGADGLSLVNTIRGLKLDSKNAPACARSRAGRPIGSRAQTDRAGGRRDVLPARRKCRSSEWAACKLVSMRSSSLRPGRGTSRSGRCCSRIRMHRHACVRSCTPPQPSVDGRHTKMHMQSLMKNCCPPGQLSTKGRASEPQKACSDAQTYTLDRRHVAC